MILQAMEWTHIIDECSKPYLVPKQNISHKILHRDSQHLPQHLPHLCAMSKVKELQSVRKW